MEQASDPSCGRYSWPLASPAFEVSLADTVLEEEAPRSVLDPCASDATVNLACAYRGIASTGLYSDPLLLRLAIIKTDAYGEKTADALGYSCAELSDEVFWESDRDSLPEIAGAYRYSPQRDDFLARWLYQLPKETRGPVRGLLYMSYLRAAELLQGDGDFDESVGMEAFWEGVAQIKGSIGENPEGTVSLFECDPRDIPCPARRHYGLVLSFLPSPSLFHDREYRTMAQRSGMFQDPAVMKRRDVQGIGLPLGPEKEYMENWSPDGPAPASMAEILSELGESSESALLLRYAEGLLGVMRSLKDVIGDSKAVLFAGNALVKGSLVPTDELLPELADKAGLKCQEPEKVHIRDQVRGLADWRFDISA